MNRNPGAECGRLALELGHAREAVVVDDLGDEAANIGMHAARALEEQAHVRRDRRVVAEQVLEHRAPRARGMRALRDLRELQRIAEQHDVARRGSHRERVGERHLPGLVDHKRVDRAVESFVREQPSRTREEQDVRACIRERRVVGCVAR